MVFVGLAVLSLSIPPKPGVQPEKYKHADKQAPHKAGHYPYLRVALKAVRIGVGAERHESFGGFSVALLACLEAVVWMDFRLRVVWTQYAVAAVTVVTLGGVTVAQLVDLAMIGIAVGFQILNMTCAAVFSDGQFERVLQCAGDAMASVAIRAIGGLEVMILQYRLAMN